MIIESFRVSKRGRDQLISLKRRTGVEQWNILCRWAFCFSLAEPSPPRDDKIPADSPVELTWRTFAGELEHIYLALLKARCRRDGIDISKKTLLRQFRLHLHRGIAFLAGDPTVSDLAALLRKSLPSENGTNGSGDSH